jgi:spore maturation protein CgeB
MLQTITAGRAGGLWYFDLSVPPLAEIVRMALTVGRIFVTCQSQMAAYRVAGVPQVLYLPQALDPYVDRPAADAPERFRCDLSFVGSGQYPDRYELLRRMAKVGRLQVRGLCWDGAPADIPVAGGVVYGAAFARVVRGAAISLGAHATHAQNSQVACTSNRMWKVLGCGGFFLGPWQAGVDRFARDGEHCAWYRGPDEAVELAGRYLADPRRREEVAAAGREHALSGHTYAHRVALLLAGRGYELENAPPAQTIS